MIIYMYIDPGKGKTAPCGKMFSCTHLCSQFNPFLKVLSRGESAGFFSTSKAL